MWNGKKSVVLSYVVCVILLFLITLACVLAPFYLSEFFGMLNIAEHEIKYNTFMWCLYPCSFFGIVAVLSLMAMLKRIFKEHPFCKQNVISLKVISICCFFVALITFIGSFYCRTFIFISVAAGFFGLILRVVKNVIQRAMEIQYENDLTV